jgi:hypothetical protein
MIMKTTMLIATGVRGAIFATLSAFLLVATRRGFGFELRTIVLCLAFGIASVISLGIWLFIRAK